MSSKNLYSDGIVEVILKEKDEKVEDFFGDVFPVYFNYLAHFSDYFFTMKKVFLSLRIVL